MVHAPLGISHFPVNDLRSTNPDLFSQLHESRGKRTMVFSTHRFGNLTKYADIIVYAISSRKLWESR